MENNFINVLISLGIFILFSFCILFWMYLDLRKDRENMKKGIY